MPEELRAIESINLVSSCLVSFFVRSRIGLASVCIGSKAEVHHTPKPAVRAAGIVGKAEVRGVGFGRDMSPVYLLLAIGFIDRSVDRVVQKTHIICHHASMKKVLVYLPVVLILGALEWVRTRYELAQVRAAYGQPFTRMMIILGVVAAVTFCSALLFQSPALKKIYRLDEH
jgi:hypothetical protein